MTSRSMKPSRIADLHTEVTVSAFSEDDSRVRLGIWLVAPMDPELDFGQYGEHDLTVHVYGPEIATRSGKVFREGKSRLRPDERSGRWRSVHDLGLGKRAYVEFLVDIERQLTGRAAPIAHLTVSHNIAEAPDGFPDGLSATMQVLARRRGGILQAGIGPISYELNIPPTLEELEREPLVGDARVAVDLRPSGEQRCRHDPCMDTQFDPVLEQV